MPDAAETPDWIVRSIFLDGVLHSRPAREFSEHAKMYVSEIRVGDGTIEVDGKSIMELLDLGGNRNPQVDLRIRARGADAVEAVDSLLEVLNRSVVNWRPDTEP